ncbi:uncharacterized protein G2W53_045229 [Senna tora]|uniref:Uncharacterized protein n=1 Tax=Senna tora TaxID=362788 RepID=A0A834SBY2_9FABA|nr:uncharacterized protein G2W53_045229 [Senna tora]
MGGVWIMSYHVPDDKSRLHFRNLHELRGKRLFVQLSETRRNLHELRGKGLVAHLNETRRFALYLRTGVDLMLQLESSWHGRSVDHVLTYFGRQIALGSQEPSRITRQRTCCGIVTAWEERGSCLTIFRTTNHGRILENFTNYEAKELLLKSVKHFGSGCIFEPEWI